ncbi:MAG: flagellar filament capping protein FliD, partial [Gammaproteobacteria bacterium]|nr:flagellar filament capping protein FliD [Gammaproteobacteria bacterium]
DNIGAGSVSVAGSDGTSGYASGTFFNTDSLAGNLNFLVGGPYSFQLEVDGVTTDPIDFNTNYYAGTATNAEARDAFLLSLQTKLNNDPKLSAAGLSVNAEWVAEDPVASPDSFALKFTSNSLGSNSTVSVVSDLAQLGIEAATSTAVAGSHDFTIGGQAATFADGVLTGSGIYAGFELALKGTLPASFVSSINVSQGSISALDTLVRGFLDGDGIISSKTDGLNASLQDIDDQRAQLADRLDKLTQQYTKKFSAMDSLVAQLNSTSSYLENQLKALPGARSSN